MTRKEEIKQAAQKAYPYIGGTKRGMSMYKPELNKPCKKTCKDCVYTNVCFSKEK